MERVIFFGSPAFALPSLDALAASELRPALVVTQPDRPAGRGRRTRPTPVRERAEALGIPVRILESFRAGDALEALRALEPDFFAVVSFGRIFPAEALAIPRRACVNAHASLLPAWRGASPINAAIVAGDAVTGVTTMEMAAELDAGPTYLRETLPIDPAENAGELSDRLALLGAPLLLRTLRAIAREGLRPVPQDAAAATKAPLLRKADGLVPWGRSAAAVHDHIRGMNPWPGSHAWVRGARIKILRSAPVAGGRGEAAPGTILEARGDAIVVACAPGAVRLVELQAEGRNPLVASEFLRGFPLAEGDVLAGPA